MKKLYILLMALSTMGTAWTQVVGDYRSVGGNWGTLASWERLNALPATWVVPTGVQGYPGQNAVPGTVTILNGDAITLDLTPANNIGALVIQAGDAPTTLTFSGTDSLTVNGAVTFGTPADGSSDKTIAIGAGTLSAGSIAMGDPGGGGDDCILSLSTGSVNVTGNIAMAGIANENFITFTGTGTLNAGGAITGGTITAGTGTVNYNGAGAQTVADYAYNNLALSGGGAKTLGGDRTITGNFLLDTVTTLTLGANDLTIDVNANRSATINGRLNVNGDGRLVEIQGGSKTLVLGTGGYLSLTDNVTGAGSLGLPAFQAYSFDDSSTVDFGSTEDQTIENTAVYGNLVTSGTGTKTLETVGGTMTFNSITIGTGTTLASSNKTMNVGGNWSNNGIFTEGTSTVVFNGDTTQTIGFATSGPTTFNNITFANTNGGITLSDPTTLAGVATFTNGVVTSDATNLLIFNSGATSSLAAATANTPSYVDGPVRKAGNQPFVFPIGDTTGFVPLAISAPNDLTDTFTAQYFRGLPIENTDITAPGITHISACDFWDLDLTEGGIATTISATFYWNANNPCGGKLYVTVPGTVKAVQYTGGSWSAASVAVGSIGSTAASGNVVFAGLTTFSPFTLGSTNSDNNPLPVVFANVTAYEKNSGVQIEWSNLTEKDVAGYTVERSANGSEFSAIVQQLPTSNQNDKTDYTAFDATPNAGANYYRIKAAETTGKVVYSKILSVNLGKETEGLRLYPNPVKGNQVNISLSNVRRGQYDLRVINAAGQDVFKQTIRSQGRTITQTLDLPLSVKPGVYNMVVTGEGYREIKMFVVQ